MRILILHNKVPFPPKDGGSIAVYNICRGFANAGHQIDILALNTKKHFVKISEIQNDLHKNIKIIDVKINTNLNHIHALLNLVFSNKPYNAVRFISKRFKQKLKTILQNNRYDIIQIEGLYMMPYIKTIQKNSNCKVSYRAHNIEHEIWQQSAFREQTFFKKRYLKILAQRLRTFELSYLNTYDYLIPITERDALILNNLGNKKNFFVSPTGIDSIKYQTQKPDFKIIKLFHLGALDWTPNQEGLIWFLKNVWTDISDNFKNMSFTIAGRNAPDWFIKHIQSYKNIVFLGEIDHAVNFIQEHNVMIVPLLSGSGMRIKIIEGMASGNIIISTSKGAEGISGIHNKEFLLADSKEEFIQIISELNTKKLPLNEISIRAQQFISNNFDNFAISKSLLDFYKKELNRRTA